jgi:site-specific DNA-methyltransferase (cytosine-N4-specific)
MSELKDSSIHLVATSPPYSMIQKWDDMFLKQTGRTEPIGKASFIWQHALLKKVWKECYRVLIDGGILCVNIGDATRSIDKEFLCYPNYSMTTNQLYEIGFSTLIPIMWKKISNRPNSFLGSGFLPPNAYISQDIEYIIVARKGRLRQFKSKEQKQLRNESKITKEERDLWFSQLWQIPGNRGAKIDSSWNMEVPNRLVQMFSVKNDIVLDPFCGRQGGIKFEKLCNELGRDFIGYTL